CAECRSALAEEQALFAAIDSGLRTVANADVPPSLIPSVRARLNEHPAERRPWLVLVLAPVAAALVLGFFIVRSLRRPAENASPPPMPASNASQKPLPPPAPAVAPAVSGANSAASSAPRTSAPLLPAHKESPAATVPEVLVPRGQEALLVSYAHQLQGRKHLRLTAELVPAPPLEPLEVAPIQIAPLDVKCLEDADSR